MNNAIMKVGLLVLTLLNAFAWAYVALLTTLGVPINIWRYFDWVALPLVAMVFSIVCPVLLNRSGQSPAALALSLISLLFAVPAMFLTRILYDMAEMNL